MNDLIYVPISDSFTNKSKIMSHNLLYSQFPISKQIIEYPDALNSRHLCISQIYFKKHRLYHSQNTYISIKFHNYFNLTRNHIYNRIFNTINVIITLVTDNGIDSIDCYLNMNRYIDIFDDTSEDIKDVFARLDVRDGTVGELQAKQY